jgi:hypothetical protein
MDENLIKQWIYFLRSIGRRRLSHTGLRMDQLTAPWYLNLAMNGDASKTIYARS